MPPHCTSPPQLVINWIASLGISAYTFYGIQLLNNFGVFYVAYAVGVSIGENGSWTEQHGVEQSREGGSWASRCSCCAR